MLWREAYCFVAERNGLVKRATGHQVATIHISRDEQRRPVVMAKPYEKSVAMTAPQQMRGVVIISLPDSESGGKTMCAAMWQEGHEQHHQQQQVQGHQQQEQQTLQTPPLPTPPAAHPARTLYKRGRLFKRVVLFFLLSLAALYLAYKIPTLYYSEMQLEEESEEKDVHVYTLHPKYSPALIKMRLVGRNLLERDMERLSKASVPETAQRTAAYPIGGNIYPDGLYYMAMRIGNPAKLYYLDMDTGSDLTWLQCDAPCRSCAVGPHGLYDPKRARVVDCRRPTCAQVQRGGQFTCSGDVRQCDYEVDYVDGSSTMGILVEDTITLVLTNGTRFQTRAVIGCGYDQQGTLAKAPAVTDGVIGLSSSKISLPSQLAAKGIANNVIGHCLAGGSNGGGYLFFGDTLVPALGMTWTPMIGRPLVEGYQARLRSIKYGGEVLELEGTTDDVGGAMFDSGTSFTYLVPNAYTAVLSAVVRQAQRSGLERIKTDTTLPFCWRGPSPFESVADVSAYFKTVTLDFGGSTWWSSGKLLELSPEGYLIVSTQGNVCLGVLDASVASLEVTNILGDISMRGYLVVYDNMREQIGWVRRNCYNRPRTATSQILSTVAHLFD